MKLADIASKLKENFPKTLIVRGEVFLSKQEFKRINQSKLKKEKSHLLILAIWQLAL